MNVHYSRPASCIKASKVMRKTTTPPAGMISGISHYVHSFFWPVGDLPALKEEQEPDDSDYSFIDSVPDSLTSSSITTASIPDLSTVLSFDGLTPEEALRNLVVLGGGTWPPTPAFHKSWPVALQTYHAAYTVISPLLPVLESSYDDKENREKIDFMRSLITGLLKGKCDYVPKEKASACRVDLEAVTLTLKEADEWQNGLDPIMSIYSGWSGYNEQSVNQAIIGFCACVNFLRHSFRWGVSPIVKEAQKETSISFPQELDVPWNYFQKRFGITSAGGCLSTCLYFNHHSVRSNFKPFYSPVYGLPEAYQKTAHWDTRLFLEMEHRFLPVYNLMGSAIACCIDEAPIPLLEKVKEISTGVGSAFRFFFTNFNQNNLDHNIWLPYLQGFTGWTLHDTNGVSINGVSGGQSLAIRTMDSFLGIHPFPPPEEEALHIPLIQREWLTSLRDYDIRLRVREVVSLCGEDCDISVISAWKLVNDELDALVRQLRVWRMGHMNRMVPYEGVRRPERMNMTSGLSFPADEAAQTTETGMVQSLKEELGRRLNETK